MPWETLKPYLAAEGARIFGGAPKATKGRRNDATSGQLRHVGRILISCPLFDHAATRFPMWRLPPAMRVSATLRPRRKAA